MEGNIKIRYKFMFVLSNQFFSSHVKRWRASKAFQNSCCYISYDMDEKTIICSRAHSLSVEFGSFPLLQWFTNCSSPFLVASTLQEHRAIIFALFIIQRVLIIDYYLFSSNIHNQLHLYKSLVNVLW